MNSPSSNPLKREFLKVLIVDNDPLLQSALAHFLRDKGYVLKGAGTAKAAHAICQTFLPDIVFLDQLLPDTDSEELLSYFISPGVGASVIMMTTFVEIDRAISAMSKGADYYIPKQIALHNVSVILEKLKEKINRNDEIEYFRAGGFPRFGELRSLSKVKEDYIEHVLTLTGDNHSRSAAILGISRSTLLAGLKKKN